MSNDTNSAILDLLRKEIDPQTLANIQKLADTAVVSDARFLDFLSRKDSRVYRHQADCIKELLRLLRSDAFPLPAGAHALIRDDGDTRTSDDTW
jgi:hypothetical protein